MSVAWDLIETFVRVAAEGSLTRAARRLGISQPTLSRQIQALEEQLGVPLFIRHARGLTVTDRGAELLASARSVDDQVQSFIRRATGLRIEPEGSVRISANEPIAVHAMGPALAGLRRDYPKIKLELVVDNSAVDLSRREADLALRMFRPVQLDLVAKRVGTVEVGLFASRDYLARCGLPNGPDIDLERHTLIGFDQAVFWRSAVRKMGLQPEQFAFRSDSMLVQLEAVRSGVGIGAIHLPIARRHAELVRVLENVHVEHFEIWLVVHQDLRADPAVRAVAKGVEQGLRDYLD